MAEEEQEKKIEKSLRYWYGNKASIDIFVNDGPFTISFPSCTTLIQLQEFASNFQSVVADIITRLSTPVDENRNVIDKIDEKEEDEDNLSTAVD